MDLNQRLKVGQEVITQAGDYLKEQFQKRHNVTLKSDKTELLDEDLKSEEIIISGLQAKFSTDSFFTEERDSKITGDLIWVIDPICGSYSYLRGVETWSLSIALIQNEQYLVGLVYQPLLENLFYSTFGNGAFKNKNVIKPSAVSDVSQAFISVEHAVFNSGKVAILKLIKDIKRIRVGHGSGAEISYVAGGHLDAVIKTDQTLMHFAGGRAIVEEAGGVFMDFNGNRCPTYFDKNKKVDYIATNKHLQDQIRKYCHF
jgi:myo-inositol-1(or 4)-monophosphatase